MTKPIFLLIPDPQYLVSEEDLEEPAVAVAGESGPSPYPLPTARQPTSHPKDVIFVERKGTYTCFNWQMSSTTLCQSTGTIIVFWFVCVSVCVDGRGFIARRKSQQEESSGVRRDEEGALQRERDISSAEFALVGKDNLLVRIHSV